MKKVIFLLVALVASMGISAQTKVRVMKILDGENTCETVNLRPSIKVVFEYVPITGTAKRNDNIDVKWVQLWENGPKFAEYNVGATSAATEYGGYYSWGGSESMNTTDYKKYPDNLLRDDDTATKLWGDNWRMPTIDEFEALIRNCDIVWTENYNDSNVKGIVVTGRKEYKNNSIFLPAAGYVSSESSTIYNPGLDGYYWTSTHTEHADESAYQLEFNQAGNKDVLSSARSCGQSVRAVFDDPDE